VVSEERVVADVGDCRFEMETSADRNDDHFVFVRSENGSELTDAFAVGAFGKADEKLFADAEDVAAFHSARESDVFEFAEFGEGLSEGSGFGSAGFRAERHDDREFVEDDGRVFDEHGVGEIGFGGEGDQAGAEFFEELFVSVVLLLCFGEVDGIAVDEGEFAVDDRGADGARDGGEHW